MMNITKFHWPIKCFFIIVIFSSSTLFAQNNNITINSNKVNEKDKKTLESIDKKKLNDKKKNTNDNSDATNRVKNLDGFDGKSWGSKYTEVLNFFRDLSRNSTTADPVEIIAVSEDKEILIKRNGIRYKYMFYKVPKVITDLRKKIKKNDKSEDNSPKLFFVQSQFSLLESKQLFDSLVIKYGRYTKSILNNDNRGAYIWDLKDGFMIQWIEPYDKGQWSGRIYYISKAISGQMNVDTKEFLYDIEKKVMQNLRR